MAEDIAKLGIKVSSGDIVKAIKRLDKLEAQSKKNEKQNKKLKSSFSGLGTALGALGLGMALKKVIELTSAQEQAVAQLDAAIKSTGASAGFTSKELQKMAASLQATSTFGDEAIISMQSVLLTFTKLQGEILPRTTQAVLDLSARMGMDLTSSAVMLGKALNDPIANLGALSRSGIQFTKTQKEMIKRMAEGGKLAQAQTVILKELETQFGGSAAAARDTFGGALQGLSNAFGDLLEEDGDGLKDAKVATEELTAILKDPATKEAFSTITGAIIDMVGALVKGVTWLTKFGDSLGKSIADFANKPESQKMVDRMKEINEELKNGNLALWKRRQLIEELNQLASEYTATYGSTFTAAPAKQEEAPAAPAATTDIAPTTSGVWGTEDEAGEFGESLEEFSNRLNEEREIQREHRELLLEQEMEYYDRLYNMQAGSQEASLKFAEGMRKGDYKSALKYGSLMLSNAAQHSKTMFGIQKALALANATATLPSAVMKSFENGGGYPWGLIPAGLMLAQGLKQIQAIKSSSFGGGGTTSIGGGGGRSTAPSAPVASGLPAGATAIPTGKEVKGQVVNVTLEGKGYSRDDVRDLLEQMNEEFEDGTILVTA